jgi:hypothetical protein
MRSSARFGSLRSCSAAKSWKSAAMAICASWPKAGAAPASSMWSASVDGRPFPLRFEEGRERSEARVRGCGGERGAPRRRYRVRKSRRGSCRHRCVAAHRSESRARRPHRSMTRWSCGQAAATRSSGYPSGARIRGTGSWTLPHRRSPARRAPRRWFVGSVGLTVPPSSAVRATRPVTGPVRSQSGPPRRPSRRPRRRRDRPLRRQPREDPPGPSSQSATSVTAPGSGSAGHGSSPAGS